MVQGFLRMLRIMETDWLEWSFEGGWFWGKKHSFFRQNLINLSWVYSQPFYSKTSTDQLWTWLVFDYVIDCKLRCCVAQRLNPWMSQVFWGPKVSLNIEYFKRFREKYKFKTQKIKARFYHLWQVIAKRVYLLSFSSLTLYWHLKD